MTQNFQNSQNENKDKLQPEETLRLLAEMAPPADLTNRVHHHLARERAKPARRSVWSLWLPAQRLQFAAAAVLVVAVAGSTWSVYHAHPRARAGANSQAPPAVQRDAASGGFGTAGAERVPPTLNPIKVPPAAKKKPSASKSAKPSPKKLASPGGAATQ
jgi:hypothetical protein